MSFLLDALDKADTDRNRTQVNELRTPVQEKRTLLRRILKAQLLVALVLASFAMGYFARPYLEREAPAAKVESMVEPNAGAMPQDAKAAPVVHEKVNTAQPAAPVKPLQTFNVKLTAISFSDVPASRFAMINGFVMYEGDVLASGERLTLIQLDAVTMVKGESEIRIALNPSGQ